MDKPATTSATPKPPLFDGVVYLLSPTLPPLRAEQLRLVLNTKGATEINPPLSINGSESTPISSRAEYRTEIQAAREALADPKLTHVITNTLNNCEDGWRDVLLDREEKDKVAVVTDLWVDKSVSLDALQPTEFYSADPFMIFSGVVACASELPTTDLEVLSAGITALGGQWRTGLTKDVTHLFCISPGTPSADQQKQGTFEHVGSLKYVTALKNQHTTHVKVLLPHWFDDVMKIGMAGLDTKPYEWPDPELLKGPESMMLPGVDGPDNLKVNERMKEREKEREERMKKDALLREEDAFKKSLYSTADLLSPGAALPDISMDGSEASHSTKPKDIWKGRRILLGRSLELMDSRREAVEAGLKRTGAVIVPHAPNASTAPLSLRQIDAEREKELVDDCDVYVTRYRSGRAYTNAVRLGKTIGTLAWLFHVQKTGVVSPPLDQLLWYPIPKRQIEGFNLHEITLTNYTGEAREYLKKLITIMGANFTPSMSGRNTALIAAYISGTKTTKAASWSIPIVNHLWLEDCFIKWRNLTPALERYIHFPPGVDFSKLLGERGIGKRVEDEMGDDELDQLEAEEDEEFGIKKATEAKPESSKNGGLLNTQNSAKDAMEVEAAVNELDAQMEDVQAEEEQVQAEISMEVDEPEPEPEPKPKSKTKETPKPPSKKSFAMRLKEKVLEGAGDAASPAKTRIRPRKVSAPKRYSLDDSPESSPPPPEPSPLVASSSKKKLTRRAGAKQNSWIDDDDDEGEVEVVAVTKSPKKAPAPPPAAKRRGKGKASDTEDEDIVQGTSSPAKQSRQRDEDEVSDEEDPSQPKRVPYSPKKYKSESARRRSKGRDEEVEEEEEEEWEVSPVKSVGKGKAKGKETISTSRRRLSKPVAVESETEEEDEDEEPVKPRGRAAPRKSATGKATKDLQAEEEEEEEEEEESAKPAPKSRASVKKAAKPTKAVEEEEEEEEESPKPKGKGKSKATPAKKLPDIRDLTEDEEDVTPPPVDSFTLSSAKKPTAKPSPPKSKGKAQKKKGTPLPPESEDDENEPPRQPPMKVGPPRGKKKQSTSTAPKVAKAKALDDEDNDLIKPSPSKTPNRMTVVLTERQSSKKKAVADEKSTSRQSAIKRTESLHATAGERASSSKSKGALAKDTKNKAATKQVEPPSSSPLSAMDVDEETSTPATETGRSKRTAATKASQKLHDEIMPDVMNYQQQLKTDKRRKSLGLPPSAVSFESQKGKKKREADDNDNEDTKDARDKKKRKTSEEPAEPISARPSKGKQKEVKEESGPDAGIRLMTTQVSLAEDTVKILSKLGVKMTTKPSECTHLLVPHLVRTEKFLCALAQAPFILREAWVIDSAFYKKLQDEKPYLLKDQINEAKYDFVLSDALERAKEYKESGGLFNGKTFYITPKVSVDKKLLRNVVESGGGTVANQTPTPRIIKGNPDDRIVVSCPEDASIWRPLKAAGLPIYLPEIILASTLKQEIDWDDENHRVAGTV